MSKHPLSIERFQELLDYDPETGIFRWKVKRKVGVNAGDIAGSTELRWGHTRLWVDGKRYMAHRVAWLLVFGRWPADMIDHINGNPSDNRIANLRDSDNRHNQQNIRHAQRDSSHGFLGVYLNKKNNKWRARIKVEDKRIDLGLFSTPGEAHAAYVKAKRKLHPGSMM